MRLFMPSGRGRTRKTLKKHFEKEAAEKLNRVQPYYDREMSPRGKNIVRGVVIGTAVVLILLGIVNGGLWDVLVKAINICTECIGLG